MHDWNYRDLFDLGWVIVLFGLVFDEIERNYEKISI